MDLVIRGVFELLSLIIPPIVGKLTNTFCPEEEVKHEDTVLPPPPPVIETCMTPPPIRMKMKPEPEPEPEPVVGDYFDISWRDSDVPRFALSRVYDTIHKPNVTKEEYTKIANTCSKLLEHYAMEARRQEELQTIKEKIHLHHPELASKIDVSKFSRCAFWEGKIALFR